MNQPLRYFIETFGCQMNVADSDRMAALLEREGAVAAADPGEADVLLLNTCSVREKPEQKVYTRLGEWRRLKRRRPGMVLGVCGCQAQREGAAIVERAPWVDLVVGTANVGRIPSLVARARAGPGPVLALELPERGMPAWMSPDPHMADPDGPLIDPASLAPGVPRLKAFVPIILGCDFACTFCIVPQTRGPERSRPVADILGEIRGHARAGVREVMLLGQTVDAYRARYDADAPPGARVYTLADLIWLIEDVDGIDRVRFTSPHPAYMDAALIDAVAMAPKACEWIHLPVQSGDNGVLKRMARRYTRERYLEIVARIRAAMPEAAITTDVIVGFPGESRRQFEATLSLVEEVRFDGAFTFAYSARPGTPAAGWEATVPEPERKAWLNELIEVQNRISRERNEALEGREFEVLVERPTGQAAGQFTGLTRANKTVNFPGTAAMVGQTVRVRALRGRQWGFMGEVVASRAG